MNRVSLDTKLLLVVSDKSGGNISYKYDDRGVVKKNRQRFFEKLELDGKKVVEVEQVHGSGMALVGSKDVGNIVKGMDGLITEDKKVSLMLKIGDCIPLVIYDPENHAVGLIHSGWRGTIEKIFLHGLMKMGNEFGTRPSDVKAWLGPCIQKCCYTAQKPPTQRVLPEWDSFIEEKEGKWHVDMVGFMMNRLVDVGVEKEKIVNDGSCTFHEKEKWFSYARHKDTGEADGRFLVIAKLM